MINFADQVKKVKKSNSVTIWSLRVLSPKNCHLQVLTTKLSEKCFRINKLF